MEAILKHQQLIVCLVLHLQLQCQRITHRHDVIGRKWRKGARLRTIRKTETHANTTIRGRHKFLKLPSLNPRKTVLAQTFPWAKPRQHDRNAAANGLAFREPAALANK